MPTDRKDPRPVIARYLNYAEKIEILQNFWNQRNLIIDGHSLLLFSNYFMEISRKCKAFGKECSLLYKRQIRFSLGYPAILYLTSRSERQHVFRDPAEVELFLTQLQEESIPEGSLPPRTNHTSSATKDQQANTSHSAAY